ncbi:MAG: ABC transporter permease subunit, partial [Solirubrobacterales bacterium]|nr:ABC transporter permease subunit [Solirubrobacterales bacterium]
IRWLERALDPYVYMFLTAPTVVFVPIYFSLFGLSRWAIVALIVQYAVFIVIVNTITAVQTVDAELVEMARVYGAKSEQVIVRKVLLRAALPLIAAGLRLGLGRAVKGMINGEILIAVVGADLKGHDHARGVLVQPAHRLTHWLRWRTLRLVDADQVDELYAIARRSTTWQTT